MTPCGVLPVCTTHLSWPLDQSHVRQAQVRAIVTAIAAGEAGARLPAVLCGDFNAEPGSDEIRMLNGQAAVPVPGVVFQDGWQVGGDGSPGRAAGAGGEDHDPFGRGLLIFPNGFMVHVTRDISLSGSGRLPAAAAGRTRERPR